MTLQCTTEQIPSTVVWLKGHTELKAGGRYEMSQKDGVLTLMIKQLEENDTDIYTCDVGTAKSMAKVTVKGENFSMNEGETTFCSYLHYYTAERFELSFLLILRFYFIFLIN